MNLSSAQQQVVDCESPTLVVLGGAGTGKTTTAATIARKTLESASELQRRDRVLFLSFSRAAATQVLTRAEGVLGRYADQVEVTTFHAFAWRMIARWGSILGIEDPVLFSPAEQKLFGKSAGLGYDALIPLATRLLEVPAIRRHFSQRWSLVIVDEFQDTNEEQWDFVQRICESARLVLLGDLNQCIYKNLPNSSGVGPQRVAAALTRPGAEQIILPDVSHRDPSYIIPAAANAVRERDFDSEAVRAAIDADMLEIVREQDPAREGEQVVEQIQRLQSRGMSVGVFSHHVDSTAQLSDELNEAGVAHEIVGLPDAVDAALRAQYAMLAYCCGETEPDDILRGLAIFVASAERGSDAPELARMIAKLSPRPDSLTRRLQLMGKQLGQAQSLKESLDIASAAYDSVGLARGESAWRSATRLLSNLLGPRALSLRSFPDGGISHLRESIAQQHLALLMNDEAKASAPVELMGLYQTKGREVDAAVVVLRHSDWFGREAEPMPDGSKLLYVLMTRARKKTIILALGRTLPSLVAPLTILR